MKQLLDIHSRKLRMSIELYHFHRVPEVNKSLAVHSAVFGTLPPEF